MHAIGEGGVKVGIQGACGGIGIPFYTRNLHQSAYRVAGHSQMMFQTHFRSIFYLCGAAAKKLVGGCRSHCTGYADFSLAAYFRA